MLVYVAQLGLDWLVRGPWKDPGGHNLPVSVNFDPEATLPILFDGGSLHLGVLLAPIVAAIAAIVFAKTLFGYQVRLVGSAPKAARFARLQRPHDRHRRFRDLRRVSRGLPASSKSPGKIGQLLPSISPGYGFSAIIVAFLGRLSPVGIFIAGLVLALDLRRRRGRADRHASAGRSDAGLSRRAVDLRARRRRARALPPALHLGGQIVSFDPQQIQDILIIIVAAATPLAARRDRRSRRRARRRAQSRPRRHDDRRRVDRLRLRLYDRFDDRRRHRRRPRRRADVGDLRLPDHRPRHQSGRRRPRPHHIRARPRQSDRRRASSG